MKAKLGALVFSAAFALAVFARADPRCSLASLSDDDYAALAHAKKPLTREAAAALPEHQQLQLCLARRLVGLIRSSDNRERLAEDLIPDDIPVGLSLYLTEDEYELVGPISDEVLARAITQP